VTDVVNTATVTVASDFVYSSFTLLSHTAAPAYLFCHVSLAFHLWIFGPTSASSVPMAL